MFLKKRFEKESLCDSVGEIDMKENKEENNKDGETHGEETKKER